MDEYIGSYRGTTAEVDPRTKRIYEKTQQSEEDTIADDILNVNKKVENAMSSSYYIFDK